MNLYSLPPFLTLCCFLGLAVMTVLRGRRTRVNVLFFILCILGAFLYVDILFAFNVSSAKTALWISRIDHFFIIFLFPLYIHFFHAYLEIPGRKWLIRTAYGFAVILMGLTLTPYYIESMQKHFFGFFAKGGILYPFFGLTGLSVTIYILMLLHHAIRHETSSIRKNRLKYVFGGFGVMGLMNGLNVFPILGYSVYPPGNLSFVPLIVFSVGLFKHDLLDMGILIQKSLLYSLLTGFLTCLYALIIIAANATFRDFEFANSIYFPIIFFLLVAFVFGPLKTTIQTMLERLFFKGKYDYQKTLKHVSQIIVSVLNIDEIGKQLTDAVINAMLVKNCIVFVGDPSRTAFAPFSTRGDRPDPAPCIPVSRESALVKFMEQHRRPALRKNFMDQTASPEIQATLAEMDRLYAEIALPMFFKETLNGFMTLGEKLSGDLFTSEDMDLLETLSSQSALAIANAHSYKVIEDLNKNLEEKVEKRTRALKDALLEKERTQEQLIRSESLAAIGQLVAGVAHELNNPLASVTGLVQASIEDIEAWDTKTPPDDNLIDDLKFADKELGRAKAIVASLLGLSRQTQTYSEAINMNAVVKDALRVLYNQHKHLDLDIVENFDKNLPAVEGNFANLGQVALNIIQNSIQAVIDQKGTIFLATRFDPAACQVVFECRDTGPGIPKTIRQDIFKPFFTTKEVGKGTGLGLYICHEIIRKHGGTITLEPSDDPEAKGARLVVRLPAISNS